MARLLVSERNNYRYIYKLTLRSTGKIYVGQTSNVEERVKQHVFSLSRGTHNNKAMQEDWTKYGGGFDVDVLDRLYNGRGITVHQTTKDEVEWMAKLGSYDPEIGYNAKDPSVFHHLRNDYTERFKSALKRSNPQKALELFG